MPDTSTDVNNKSVNSSAADIVKPDVKPLIDASADKKTPESVPYDRFKEVNDKASKVTGLEAEIAELKTKLENKEKPATATDPVIPDDDEPFDWSSWDTADTKTDQTMTPATPVNMTWDQMNADFRTKLDGERPLDAMLEFNQRVKAHERQLIADARKIPGFDDVRNAADAIPEHVVQQAMQNETFIRTMMAKLQSSNNAKSVTVVPSTPIDKPKTVEELIANAKQEERERLSKEYDLKLTAASGMAAEGSTSLTANSNIDAYELDDNQKALYTRMGLNVKDPAVVAGIIKRLEFDNIAGGL